MSAPETAFPPIALYLVLSLAVAMLSVIVTSYRDVGNEPQLKGEWYTLFAFSAGGSILALAHLGIHLFLQLLSSILSSSPGSLIHQFLHFAVLAFFSTAFLRMWLFWVRRRIKAQTILGSEEG